MIFRVQGLQLHARTHTANRVDHHAPLYVYTAHAHPSGPLRRESTWWQASPGSRAWSAPSDQSLAKTTKRRRAGVCRQPCIRLLTRIPSRPSASNSADFHFWARGVRHFRTSRMFDRRGAFRCAVTAVKHWDHRRRRVSAHGYRLVSPAGGTACPRNVHTHGPGT